MTIQKKKEIKNIGVFWPTLTSMFVAVYVSIVFGLNIFYSWQNMTKDWAEQNSYVSPLHM